MEVAKLGKKGQVSIPRSVLKQLGLEGEGLLLVGTTDDGAIVLRPAAVYPIEMYSNDRLREFREQDRMTQEEDALLRRKLRGEARE